MDKFRDTIRQIRLNYFRGLISEEDARHNFANAYMEKFGLFSVIYMEMARGNFKECFDTEWRI